MPLRKQEEVFHMAGKAGSRIEEVLQELAGSYAVWVEAGNEFCIEEQLRQRALEGAGQTAPEQETLEGGLARNPYETNLSAKTSRLMASLERVALRVGREELPYVMQYLSGISQSLAGLGTLTDVEESRPLSELAALVRKTTVSIVPPAEKYTPERPTLHPSIGEPRLTREYLQ